MTEEQVFLAALDLPDAASRAAYLDEACGTNAGLRQQVEALLASHFQSGEFLDVPAAEQVGTDSNLGDAVTIQSNTMAANKDSDDEAEALGFLAPTTRPDSLGRIGHYEVLQILGKGGFGIVFRAFDDVLQRVVAIKVMAPQMAATSPARKRFLREARTSAQVRHENVVQVYEVGEQPLPYLVMEFIPGETLQQRIDRMGPLDVPETLRIGRQIAEGLAAAHATDLIHRDIKPGNVLLEGGQHKVKITDFGLARAADDASMTQSGQIAGTPMYMAPEQALGETLDQRADLFSLGSVLYQMVAGRPPFRANTAVAVLKRVVDDTPRNIREVIPETPQWLCDIIAKLHAKKPEDRYQSAREVADVLADCEAQLKQNSKLRDFSRIPREKSAPRRSTRTTLAASAVVVLLLVIGGVWFSPTALLYLSNRGELKLLPEEGLSGVIVLQNDSGVIDADVLHAPVTDWLDMTKDQSLKLPPGRYQLNVSTFPAGTRVSQWQVATSGAFGRAASTIPVVNYSAIVTVERGHRVTLRAVVHKPAADPTLVSVAPETEGEWVQLFNGKDLTGWKTHPEQLGNWDVTNGILVGHKSQSHLFTERANFANFHLRAEVKINHGGDSGIRFRAPFALARGKEAWQVIPAGGYEAEFNRFPRASAHTGSVWRVNPPFTPTKLFGAESGLLVLPDEWAKYEVIADGNRIVTKLNGREVANCVDPESMHQSGHIALQCFHSGTTVQFRKIEIKELPPDEPGWVQLFNGQDLTGWKTDSELPGHWEVKDGILVGSQRRGFLLSERGDFADFHLRVQVKINLGGDSGILFRAGSKIPQDGGYEAEIHKNRTYARKTGTITALQAGPPIVLGLVADDSLTKSDEWFDLEIIAQQGHFITKINGRETANCSVPANPHAAGQIGLQVWNPNTVVQFRKIEIKELPASPPVTDGFVQLYNGKDLTGWQKHPNYPGNWHVNANGHLVGEGQADYAFLATERDDFENFHLRIEAQVATSQCDGGVFFRVPFPRFPTFDEINICFDPATPSEQTGSLLVKNPGKQSWISAKGGLAEAAQWLTLEIIAEGEHVVTKVNGKVALDTRSPSSNRRGHILLQQTGNQTSIRFRKIEIKELPTTPPVDGFVSLFNGKDLAGWKKHSLSGGDWSVVDGAIDGRGNTSYLFSESGDYDNFHLRVEAKINGNGDAGVCFRTPFDVKGLGQTGPAKFALLEGYEAAIAARPNWANHTGSLTAADGTLLQAGPLLPHKADEWFVLEVIADGNHIRTLVDGKPVADYTDEDPRATRGHIALQVWGPNITSVQFRKIEIKELPASAASPPIAVSPFTDADVQRIAALPVAEQYEEVCKELRKRNKEYSAEITQEVRNGQILGLEMREPGIRDLSPVRALPALERVECSGGTLEDISCLQGMRLFELSIRGSLVSDLSPLKGMPLQGLECTSCSKLTDLSPLAGMPLTGFSMAYTPIKDLTPLKGMKFQDLNLEASQVSDLSPLAGMPLTQINYRGTPVTDISALKGMPLKSVICDFQSERDAAILRSIKTLETINGKPAAEFWERYEKGESK